MVVHGIYTSSGGRGRIHIGPLDQVSHISPTAGEA